MVQLCTWGVGRVVHVTHGSALTFYSIYCLGFRVSLVFGPWFLVPAGRCAWLDAQGSKCVGTFMQLRSCSRLAGGRAVVVAVWFGYVFYGPAGAGCAKHTNTVNNRQQLLPKTVGKLRISAQKP